MGVCLYSFKLSLGFLGLSVGEVDGSRFSVKGLRELAGLPNNRPDLPGADFVEPFCKSSEIGQSIGLELQGMVTGGKFDQAFRPCNPVEILFGPLIIADAILAC